MYSFIRLATLFAASTTLVVGHGVIKDVVINGQTFPGAGSGDSPVRAVQSGDPILDVNSDAMICGTDAKNAPAVASAKAGDKIEIGWRAESGGGPWFHNVGPVLTYMAKCDGDCKSFNPSASTKWFKIDELGQIDGSDKWYQSKMNDGSRLPVTIPSSLSDGGYLLRHEIIALQNANSKDLAEFYPGCIQLSLSGGSKANANTNISPEATFPGAYKDTDPGIKVDVYTPPLNYKFPGPAIANIAQGSGNGDDSGDNNGNDNGGDDNAPPASSTAPANAAPSPSSTGKCKLRKRSNSTKTIQKKALRAHAKRRMVEASY